MLQSAPDAAVRFDRFCWPKLSPQLSPSGQRISDEFMKLWHEELPARFGIIERFNHSYPLRSIASGPCRTIELGAGLGAHFGFERDAGRTTQQDYHCVELRENMVEELCRRFPSITAVQADCQRRLPYPNQYFQRAVAVHVFEHLPELPAAVAELRRVLKASALVSLVIPCDPGLAYECARKISAERLFRRHFKMDYRWLISREHINSPREIMAVMDNAFELVHCRYFPLLIPMKDANLVIGLTYRRK